MRRERNSERWQLAGKGIGYMILSYKWHIYIKIEDGCFDN